MTRWMRSLQAVENWLLLMLALPIALPLMVIGAALIKLDSPGPVLYVSKRVGQGGRLIPVLKFRTMHVDAQARLQRLLMEDAVLRGEWERFHKLRDDPRVTRLGRWLRRSSLDELPQLLNVLAGQMYLIGPRPVFPHEFVRYYHGQARRHYLSVKPGITGLWQVCGRSDLDFPTRVLLDSWYVAHWSVWLDLWILLRTIKVVLRREGAY